MGALVGPHNLSVLLEHDAGSMRQQARRDAVGTCRRRLNPMTTERSPPSETGDERLPGPPAGRRTFTPTTCAGGSDGEFESHPTAAAGRRPLPTMQVVIVDESHPPVELVTVAAPPEPRSSSPAVPSACP